jgi:hypothetical protein
MVYLYFIILFQKTCPTQTKQRIKILNYFLQIFSIPTFLGKYSVFHKRENSYTGSLQSMATVKYLENGFSEILEIW